MSIPTSEPLPDDADNLPPARRRRNRRMLVPQSSDERAAFLDELAHRTTPSFDYFLFSLLAGAVLGIGFLLNAPALLVLGALLSPFMAPVVGLSLATVVGSLRFFLQTLVATAISLGLIFGGGALAGLGLRIWPDLPVDQARYYSQFNWPTIFVLSLGMLLTIVSLVRSEEKPSLPSVALAYGLFLPTSAAGFGLTANVPHLWPDGVVVAGVLLAWSILLGAATFVSLKFRPLSFFGYTLGTAISLAAAVLIIGLSGVGAAFQTRVALPPPLPTRTPTPTTTSPPTPTSPPPSATPTPTNTLIPTSTPTQTITPSPTPVWAVISAPHYNGAVIRDGPDVRNNVITSVINGTLVQVLPDTQQNGGLTWSHVRTSNGIEGWIVQALLVTATPAPNW